MINGVRFDKIVPALAHSLLSGAGTRSVGAEWLFMITGEIDGTARRVSARSLSLTVEARTVTVQPGVYRAFEAVNADGVVVGEAHGVLAIWSIALDYVLLPIAARKIHEHDACAV